MKTTEVEQHGDKTVAVVSVIVLNHGIPQSVWSWPDTKEGNVEAETACRGLVVKFAKKEKLAFVSKEDILDDGIYESNFGMTATITHSTIVAALSDDDLGINRPEEQNTDEELQAIWTQARSEAGD